MNSHEIESATSQNDSMTFLRSDEIQPDKFSSPESVRDTLDVVGHEVDKVALGTGVSRAFAEALAREKSLSMREDQLEAYRTGGSAIEDFKIQAAQDNAMLESLYAYAAGEVEPSDEVRELMDGRIRGIREELKGFNGEFTPDKITAVTGEVSPGRLHTIEGRLRELSKLNTPLELKDMRDHPGDIPDREPVSPPRPPERSAESSPSDSNRMLAEAQRLGIATALQETPRQFNDRKGAALVIKTMRDLGVNDEAIATFARNIAEKNAILRGAAAKIHGDKPLDSQELWAENQLWESLRSDPVWEALVPQIKAQGDDLAGRGATLSQEKVNK